MQKTFVAICLIVCAFNLKSQQEYRYKLDLRQVVKDAVKVSLVPPIQTAGEALFIIPKVVPGTYAVKDYGRFIKKFSAYNSKGKKLKVKQQGIDRFYISHAEQISSIEYYVNDSWDDKNKKEFVFQPSGSDIETGKAFVINNHCFFGYFEKAKMLPFHIEVIKPSGFYGATHLNKISETDTTDKLYAKNYVELADNPVMYSLPDTSVFDVGNMHVKVAVFSANGKVKSDQVASYLQPMGRALERFFNPLPVNEYLFIYFFDDPANLHTGLGKGLDGGYGALEHHHCSFYYLPETTIQSQLKETITSVSSHEFLHILTPLNIHSEEIEDFDFLDPKMSAHLWMYEGVTEYFSQLCQLQDSLITEDRFISDVRSKINQSMQFGNFSYTEMSRNVLQPVFQARYNSVYNKGAVLALMLDIAIMDLSSGQKTLKSVMLELKTKYGPLKPFKDENLIPDFVSMVDGRLQTFFDDYITGGKAFDYAAYFNKIGWNFDNEKQNIIYVPGYLAIKYDENAQSFSFVNVKENVFGIRNGDVLISVNGERFDIQQFNAVFDKYFRNNPSSETIEIEIMRGGKRYLLKNNPVKSLATIKNYIEKQTEMNESQLKLRSILFGG